MEHYAVKPGDGDLFGYAVVDYGMRCSDIFAWGHEDDSRRVVATHLHTFLEGWLGGTIEL